MCCATVVPVAVSAWPCSLTLRQPVAMAVSRLKKRADFVFLKESGRSYKAPAFVLLWAAPAQTPANAAANPVRIGFTASKRLGNAVARNRARRRLRAAVDRLVRLNGAFTASQPVDINIIARHKVFEAPFETLLADLQKALEATACCSTR